MDFSSYPEPSYTCSEQGSSYEEAASLEVGHQPARFGLVRHISFLKRGSPRQLFLLRATILCCLLFGLALSETGPQMLTNQPCHDRGYEAASMCRGHSHNDYHQADPLSSALKYGLKSVEVDVFPRQGGLWVAHTVFELTSERTIENLYIDPILRVLQRPTLVDRRTISRCSVARRLPFFGRKEADSKKDISNCPRGGSDMIQRMRLNHPNVDNLNLLVDFKGDAQKSAALLQSALAPLRPYMSRVDHNGQFHQGKLTVLISGNRPSDDSLRSANGERFLFLDGRLGDVYTNSDTNLVPLVSLSWRQLRIARAFGRAEAYMKHVVDKAHAQGKLVRIWGVPNNESFWASLVKGGIDLLSIDDHAKFARFVSTTQFGM